MQAKDYCVSLEMAQRAELHDAMAAAGYFPGENCKVVNIWWSEVPKEGSGDWQLFIHRQFLSEVTGHGGHIAYHLGELWCAAKVLAAKLRAAGEPDETPYTMELCWNLGHETTDARTWDEIGQPLPWHSDDEADLSAPDALAELVIALHKATTEADHD